MSLDIKNLILEKQDDYELLDSGSGEKLERFGKFVLSRPDPQALWPKKLAKEIWSKADAYFDRSGENANWHFSENIDKKWQINFSGLNLWIKPTAFKHTGLFPEQALNWIWLKEIISKAQPVKTVDVEVLNLFGYTGSASLICAQAGANVVHIDASKAAINWGKENVLANGLEDKKIRWILEDALIFVKREIKREHKYAGIIMDPPAFGHGPTNELWKIEEDFLPLVEACVSLLKEEPLFFILNGYSAGYSALAYGNNLKVLTDKYAGQIETGELAIRETSANRLLPAGIFARWSK